MTVQTGPTGVGDARADDLDREFRMLIDGEWVERRVGRDVLSASTRSPRSRGAGSRSPAPADVDRAVRRRAPRVRRGRLAADAAGRARRGSCAGSRQLIEENADR